MAEQKQFTVTIEGKPSIINNEFKNIQSFDKFDAVIIWAYLFENWRMPINEPVEAGARVMFFGESHNIEILRNH